MSYTAVRGWVAQRGTLTVITGPIFEVNDGLVSYEVIGDGNVAVPTHFYKIIVDANSTGYISTLAFVIPNEDISGSHYSEYLDSIDVIESATGLDFLSALSGEDQQQIESVKAMQVW